jgi:hypothetical protein
MSQHTTDPTDPSIDPFFHTDPSFFTTNDLNNDTFFSLFNHTHSSANTPSTCTPGTDLFDIDFDPSLPTTVDTPDTTSASSNVSTPDFASYAFGQRANNSEVYSDQMDVHTPHPYPKLLRQGGYEYAYPSYNDPAPEYHRGVPVREENNNQGLKSQHPTQLQQQQRQYQQKHTRTNPPSHRRSLSQGDADRIAAANASTSNPSFFRLQLPRTYTSRTRSATPEGGRKSGRVDPYPKGVAVMNKKSNNNARGNDRRVRSGPPTSMPVRCVRGRQDSEMVKGVRDHEELRDNGVDRSGGRRRDGAAVTTHTTPNGFAMQLTKGPRFAFMSHADQIQCSSRVIEIGAMAVVSAQSIRQGREICKGIKGSVCETEADVLRLVDMVERFFDVDTLGGGEKKKKKEKEMGLKGCVMIRAAIALKGTCSAKDKHDNDNDKNTDGEGLFREREEEGEDVQETTGGEL